MAFRPVYCLGVYSHTMFELINVVLEILAAHPVLLLLLQILTIRWLARLKYLLLLLLPNSSICRAVLACHRLFRLSRLWFFQLIFNSALLLLGRGIKSINTQFLVYLSAQSFQFSHASAQVIELEVGACVRALILAVGVVVEVYAFEVLVVNVVDIRVSRDGFLSILIAIKESAFFIIIV